MKAENRASLEAALSWVRIAFRKWCGMLSVEEIVTNRDLSIEIARLERMLACVGGM